MGAAFEALDELIFMAPSDLIGIFYNPNIAILTMCRVWKEVEKVRDIMASGFGPNEDLIEPMPKVWTELNSCYSLAKYLDGQSHEDKKGENSMRMNTHDDENSMIMRKYFKRIGNFE